RSSARTRSTARISCRRLGRTATRSCASRSSSCTRRNSVRREQARLLVLFALVLAAGLAAQHAGLGERADRALLDAQFRLLRERAPQPVDKDVVLVGIDEASFQVLREPFALWHPHLGRFLQAMA